MTKSLEELLDAARREPRGTRINFRDDIAAFGTEAIPEMSAWLGESELAAFAVRVIAKAGMNGARSEAIAALAEGRHTASAVIRGDIDEALGVLGYKPPARTAPPQPPVEIREDLYEALLEAARSGKTMTYTDAGAIIGLTMRNPHHRRLLGQHLGAISEREAEQGRPMLSAVVVQKGEKRTGTGFAQLGEELGLKGALDDDRSFDVRQLHEVFAFWASPPAEGEETDG